MFVKIRDSYGEIFITECTHFSHKYNKENNTVSFFFGDHEADLTFFSVNAPLFYRLADSGNLNVYVMNDRGETIDKFWFNEKKEGSASDPAEPADGKLASLLVD